jgi:hypothetical protein
MQMHGGPGKLPIICKIWIPNHLTLTLGGYPGYMPGFPPVNPDDAWQEFPAPDGRQYYYNYVTRENTWNKPEALIQREGLFIS